MSVVERNESWLWFAAALSIAGAALAVQGGPELTNDSFQYLSEAGNVVAGRGLTTSILHFDVEYAQGRLPAPMTTFPPGYALAIAPLHLLGIPAAWAGVLISALAIAGLVPLMIRAARLLGLTPGATRAVLLLTITSSQLLFYATSVLTEGLFTWLTLAAIVLVLEYETAPQGPRALRILALAALCAGLAWWVRYAGIFLVATMGGFYGLRFVRRRTAADFAALLATGVGAAAVAAGLARNWVLSGSIRGGNTKAVTRSVAEILTRFPKLVPRLVFGEVKLGNHLLPTAKFLVLIVVATMAWMIVRRATSALGRSSSSRPSNPATFAYAFLAVYTAGITWLGLTTMITYDVRMFVVVLPVAFLLAGQGLSATERATTSPSLRESGRGRAAARGWVAVAAGGMAFYLVTNGLSTFVIEKYPPPLTTTRRALAAVNGTGHLRDWIEENVPKDAVIAAVDGQATGFELRRPTLSLIEGQFSDQRWTEAHAKSVLQRFGAQYLILYPGDTSERAAVQQESPFLKALLDRRTPPWVIPIADNGSAAVFRIAAAERRADAHPSSDRRH